MNIDHYHVLAIHDWGGSQQCDHGWDDRFTLAEAENFAFHVLRADTNSGLEDLSFGYPYFELRSCNVAPGYEAVWILGCDRDNAKQCHDKMFTDPECALGKPYWTLHAVDQIDDTAERNPA